MGRMQHSEGGKQDMRSAGRALIIAAAMVAICLIAAGGTLAWYSQKSSLTNLFGRGTLDPAVSEKFDPAAGLKSDVAVEIPENTSNVPAYVRAHVDIYWEDAQGNRMWDEPVAAGISDVGAADAFDYEIVWANMSAGGQANSWISGADGVYYWSSPVKPGASTAPLVVSLQENVRHDDGRKLVAAIAVQAIQANPDRAFMESWAPHCGLSVGDDGVLVTDATNPNGKGGR